MTAFTQAEGQELTRLEAVIEKGLATFVEVGQALDEIRSKRLWRLAAKTFAIYCREKWNLSVGQVSRKITAARVAAAAEGLGHAPPKSAREGVAINTQAKSAGGGGSKLETLTAILDRRKKEIEEAEKAAAAARPSLDKPPPDKLAKIRRHIQKSLKEIDGSIDTVLADYLEKTLREVLAKIEEFTPARLAA